MTRPAVEVADILRAQGQRFLDRYRSSLDFQQLKALRAIQRCRTAALGGHCEASPSCGYQAISYNSCRNRHCPKCQAPAWERWLAARERDLLATSYFHVVFTVPHELNLLALENPTLFYGLLFTASAQTLLEIAAEAKPSNAPIQKRRPNIDRHGNPYSAMLLPSMRPMIQVANMKVRKMRISRTKNKVAGAQVGIRKYALGQACGRTGLAHALSEVLRHGCSLRLVAASIDGGVGKGTSHFVSQCEIDSGKAISRQLSLPTRSTSGLPTARQPLCWRLHSPAIGGCMKALRRLEVATGEEN